MREVRGTKCEVRAENSRVRGGQKSKITNHDITKSTMKLFSSKPKITETAGSRRSFLQTMGFGGLAGRARGTHLSVRSIAHPQYPL